jgi:TatD DNase family protein
MLIDTHSHIASRQFDADREQVLARAWEAGVLYIVSPATDLDDCAALTSSCAQHTNLYMAAGIHPCDAHTVKGDDWVSELRKHASQPKVVAIGEIGLDYYHAPPEGFDLEAWRSHQAQVLRSQLEIAVELGLNVILHNRESWDDLVAAVAPFEGKLRAVFHCYTGTAEQAKPLLAAGHLVSFTGIVSFKNAALIQQTVRDLPEGSFMLETDSPYLAPVPHRGKRCEPAYVAETAKTIAALRGVSFGDIAESTGRTACNFFRLPTFL